MTNYISSDKLIDTAKEKGIDFGKGDPYNRLRYYTKMGWLPHMIRKKDDKEGVKGHYPTWALDRLLLIESLKDKGLSNEDLSKKLNAASKWDALSSIFNLKDLKTKAVIYSILVILIVVILSESGLLPIGTDKATFIHRIISAK